MKLTKLMQTGISAATASAQGLADYDSYPTPVGEWDECVYTPQKSVFSIWSPQSDGVKLTIYNNGMGDDTYLTARLKAADGGLWTTEIAEDLQGKFYTFNVRIKGKWLGETPGIKAKAVCVNGSRGAILDMKITDPDGWDADQRPPLRNPSDIIIYEMHHRDFSASCTSGITHQGKFLALTENGTRSPEGLATGIDHLKELGVTHVHLLPSFDFASIDENHLERPQYNWGYDPLNYNVPEGSYATDPYTPATRIREFKQMIQALHKTGIRVVLDVVYNHTFDIKSSNFQRTVPDYFYRKRPDGTYANASGCLNETASERPMMRRYMIESVLYWAKEYHIDGFRFDLMGCHDIETMNLIGKALHAYDPNIFIYGEGWAAEKPQLPNKELAMKANISKMPDIAVFGDEARDTIRGPLGDDSKAAFLNAVPGNEMSIKFGIVGAIRHPQIDNSQVNYSKTPWAKQPTQAINYVSCHDGMCLTDILKSSMPKTTEHERIALDKLAQTIVLTSQGIPFIFCGEEMNRTKKGVHNSYNSPDSINAIDWSNKTKYKDLFNYCKGLIALRKAHPAFRLGDAELVRKHLVFLPSEKNVIAYSLNSHAGGDAAEQITVIFNANRGSANQSVSKGTYKILCVNGEVSCSGFGYMEGGDVSIPAQSALILSK